MPLRQQRLFVGRRAPIHPGTEFRQRTAGAAQCLRAEEFLVKAEIPFQFGFDAVQVGLLLLEELNNASILAFSVLAVYDPTKALTVL